MKQPLVIHCLAAVETVFGALRLRRRPVRIKRPVSLGIGELHPLQVVEQHQDITVDRLASVLARNEGVHQLHLVEGIQPRVILIGEGHRQYPDRRAGRLGRNKQAQNTRIRVLRLDAPGSSSKPGEAA